jgi:acyl-CoA thioesterase-1
MGDMKHAPQKMLILLTIMAFFCLSVNSLYAAGQEKKIAEKKLLVFGDSLTAGLGVPYDKAFPAQLEKKLRAEGYAVTVINTGVSGDTTSGGLSRLDWTLLQQKPDFVILELGANDMLRAIDPALTRGNLQKMLELLQQKKIPVLLAGMKAMLNLGEKYVTDFDGIYPALAKKYNAVYYPFFLEGVALHPELIQEDGMHPNPAGVAVIVDKILPDVKKLLGAKIEPQMNANERR